MAVSAAQADAYAKQSAALVDKATAALSGKSDEAAKLMQQAMDEVLARAAKLPEASWTTNSLGNVVQQIDSTMAHWGIEMDQLTKKEQQTMAHLASQSVFGPAVDAGIIPQAVATSFPPLDAVLLDVLGGFRTSLITKLAKDAKTQIAQRVSVAIISDQPRLQALAAIEDSLLGAGAGSGPFGSLFNRAKTIYDTESMRAYSLAKRARGHQLASIVPKVLHRWSSVGDKRVRPTHVKADQLAPIPFDRRFAVGDVKLLYPREPPTGASNRRAWAAETINCRCSEVHIIPPGAEVSDNPSSVRAQEFVDSTKGRMAKMAAGAAWNGWPVDPDLIDVLYDEMCGRWIQVEGGVWINAEWGCGHGA